MAPRNEFFNEAKKLFEDRKRLTSSRTRAIVHCNRCCGATGISARVNVDSSRSRKIMQNDFLQFINEASTANRTAFETFEQFCEANMQTWNKLINAQLDLAGIFYEGSAKQLRVWSEAKDFREILAAQSQLVAEHGEKVVKNARQQVAIVASARDAYTAWIEQGVDSASENLKRTAGNTTLRAA
jgi:phasin family protein